MQHEAGRAVGQSSQHEGFDVPPREQWDRTAAEKKIKSIPAVRKSLLFNGNPPQGAGGSPIKLLRVHSNGLNCDTRLCLQQEQRNWSRLVIPTAQCLLKGIFSASEITNSVTTEEFEITTPQGMISPNCWQLE